MKKISLKEIKAIMRLAKEFYESSALKVAPMILGMNLCRNINGKTFKFKITETEAYCGEQDTACHAYKGKTERTKVMYEPGGVAYVYLCYGIHNLLNIVTGVKNSPEAVLIRGIENFYGPGKLTKKLQIDKSLNGENLIESNKLWIESTNCKYDYLKLKRIGINYATKEYINKLWRFKVKQFYN